MVPPPPEPGVRFLPLTKGAFAKVDEADFADVSRWHWHLLAIRNSDLKYAVRHERHDDGRDISVLLHRYLMDSTEEEEVDHINGDGLNNRRDNLRNATHVGNMRNGPSRVGTSRFKGVSRNGDRWRVVIRHNYDTIKVGVFDDEEMAARAYDGAARRLHGDFACTNFPIGNERSALR